jgi:hypothetical protein
MAAGSSLFVLRPGADQVGLKVGTALSKVTRMTCSRRRLGYPTWPSSQAWTATMTAADASVKISWPPGPPCPVPSRRTARSR